MKVASILFLVGFTLIFFSLKKNDQSFLISHRTKTSPLRSIANTGTNKCMRDLFNVEELKKEVKELEDSEY
jgi:hypothetical protein